MLEIHRLYANEVINEPGIGRLHRPDGRPVRFVVTASPEHLKGSLLVICERFDTEIIYSITI